MHHPTDEELERTVAKMLQIGVSLAAITVLAGGIFLLRHPTLPIQNYSHFSAINPSLRSYKGTTIAAFHLQAPAIVQFGLLLLIATPVTRVLFCIIGFSRQRNYLYVGISSVVLTILVYSLTKGLFH